MLDSIKTHCEAGKQIVDKAKFEEVRDYRDVIVDLYNLDAEKAGREIAMVEMEKKKDGIYNIQSGTIGNSAEQIQDDIINSAMKELGIK